MMLPSPRPHQINDHHACEAMVKGSDGMRERAVAVYKQTAGLPPTALADWLGGLLAAS